ncbi:hypothetical protein WJX74_001645 [Apatococcus lobatus]|uniref:Uncharacterized protein n=1 Tax=Apatococcus lobatus TaxID=904363 RepID=A0AAW1RV79_9CHLO
MADLHTAARNNEVAQLHVLLAKGADINSRDKHSRTPLHLAAWAGKLEAVKALLAAKCNAGASALDDTTALHFAAQKGHTEICRQLLAAGVTVNSRNRKGMTALHFAAQSGHRELIELLIKRHANFKATNGKNKTPLDVAKNITTKQLLQELIATFALQNPAPVSAECSSAQLNGSEAKPKSNTVPPPSAAEGAQTSVNGPQPVTSADAMASFSTGAMPSPAAVAEQGPGPLHIGPMLPPGANPASADLSGDPAGTGQETSHAQIGPVLPPGITLASDSLIPQESQTQIGSDFCSTAGSLQATDSKDITAMLHKGHANEEDTSQHPPPSSKAAAHMRRKREEPATEAADGPTGSLTASKKAKVSLAHLGDDQEDV